MTGVGVVGGTGGGGRFRVSLACPDSEWLDPRRNVFELGGKLPPALRNDGVRLESALPAGHRDVTDRR